MAYNKIEPGFAQMVFAIGGALVTGIGGAEYSDEREKTNNYGAGSTPVSRSYGQYKAKGKLTLHHSEVEAIQALAPDGDITSLAPFDVTITTPALAGTGYVIHKLRGCEFLGNMRSMKVGDNMFLVDLDLIMDSIAWK